MADVHGESGGDSPKKTTQIGGKTSNGKLVALKVSDDGTVQTSGSADFTATVGAAHNSTVAQMGISDGTNAIHMKGNSATGSAYISPPYPDTAETITPTVGSDPATGDMVEIDEDTQEIVFESVVTAANSATAVRTVFFGESRIGSKVKAIPGADFTNLEATAMYPYRWAPSGVIGMLYKKIGARLYYTDGGGGAPTMSTKFQQRK